MTFRSTLVMVTVAACAIGALIFQSRTQVSNRDIEVRQQALLDFDPGEVGAIRINNGSLTTRLEVIEGRWRVVEPFSDRADGLVIQELLREAADLRSHETIRAGRDEGELKAGDAGVSSPKLKLALALAGGKQTEIWFGKETVIEKRGYARLPGDDFIEVVDDKLKNLVALDPSAFRDHLLFPCDPVDVASLRIERQGGVLELRRTGDSWEIRRPERARADGAPVEALVKELTGLNAERFVDEKSVQPKTEASSSVKIIVEDSRGSEMTLEIPPGGSSPSLGYLPERDHVAVELPATIAKFVTLTPRELREPSLLRLMLDSVDRIAIRQGTNSLDFRRDGEGWRATQGGFPVDPVLVERLVARLSARGLAVFEAETAASLPDNGFDRPWAMIKFSSFLSEESVHQKAGEHPIAEIRLGAIKNGRHLAQNSMEPFAYSVPSDLLDGFEPAESVWKDRSLLRGEPVDVRWIKDKSTDFRVERRDDDSWKRSGIRGKIVVGNLESVAASLAELRAVQWLSDAPPSGKPVRHFEFGWHPFSEEHQKTLELRVWDVGGVPVAMITGEKAAFELPRPTFELLLLPLSP